MHLASTIIGHLVGDLGHLAVDVLVRQDKAISVEVMRALMEEFEQDWSSLEREGGEDEEQEKILFGALFVVVAYMWWGSGERRYRSWI